jgi:uncharacterized membrane protein
MNTPQEPERAAHTVHRLEAFSDIVIGFCLAELGLELLLPKNSSDFASVWASATFFVSAFVLIAVLWWLHHRIFTSFFVLSMPMVIINFGMLCALVLSLYFLDCVVRLAAANQDFATFIALFTVSFALVYILLGVMLLVGILLRRNSLTASELRWGFGQVARIASIFPAGAATLAVLERSPSAAYVAVGLVVLVIIVRRLILPRWLARVIPDAPLESSP